MSLLNVKAKYLTSQLDKLMDNRLEAIYAYSYMYIKEIVIDEEKTAKYGTERSGYEQFKQNEPGWVKVAGETSLRSHIINDEVVGYVVETENVVNTKLGVISDIYEEAKQEFFRLLGVTDPTLLEYWLDTQIEIDFRQANSYMYAVKKLDRMLVDYFNEDEVEFRAFIDRLK
jgi:hypothetical protein